MQIDPTKLVEARLGRAMSQEEAAIACDLSARTIQRIEAGHAASLESTKALITIFGVGIIDDPASQAAPARQPSWSGVAKWLGLASQQTASWTFVGLRLMFAAVFVFVAFSKLLVPAQTGLFFNDGFYSLGVAASTPGGTTEVLGYWITPLMLVAATGLVLSVGKVRRLVL